jgi:hypothetical protein
VGFPHSAKMLENFVVASGQFVTANAQNLMTR